MNIDATGYHALLASPAASYVQTARFSPDGATVVYDYTDGTHGHSIYLMNSSGGGARRNW